MLPLSHSCGDFLFCFSKGKKKKEKKEKKKEKKKSLVLSELLEVTIFCQETVKVDD